MHKMFVTGVTATALIAAGSLAPASAVAMPLNPAGVQVAAAGIAEPTPVYYRCPVVWRCHPRGCGWRRVCHGYYWPQAYYYDGPYWGHPGWRHHYRHWR